MNTKGKKMSAAQCRASASRRALTYCAAAARQRVLADGARQGSGSAGHKHEEIFLCLVKGERAMMMVTTWHQRALVEFGKSTTIPPVKPQRMALDVIISICCAFSGYLRKFR